MKMAAKEKACSTMEDPNLPKLRNAASKDRPATNSLARTKHTNSKNEAAVKAVAAEASAKMTNLKPESISSQQKGSRIQLMKGLEKKIQAKLMLSHGNHGVAVNTQIKWKALAIWQG